MEVAGDNVTLTDPPVGAPTSPFLGDPEVPSPGPPPGVELSEPIEDSSTPAGEYQVVAKNTVDPSFKKAGISPWLLVVGGAVLLGVVVAARRRKKKKGRKKLKKYRPVWEMK
jgi:LPXTG-motif cell wall-anchored protein